MTVITREIELQTNGQTDIRDITAYVEQAVDQSHLTSGTVTIFCPGSTGGLTAIEFERGIVQDLQQVLEEIMPVGRDYRHHLRWGDDNGSAHLRAALMGPSLTVPFVGGRLTLGTWQQIVFCDFDTRPRKRNLILQLIGE